MGDKFWLAFKTMADRPPGQQGRVLKYTRYVCSSAWELFQALVKCRDRGPRLRTISLLSSWHSRNRFFWLWRRGDVRQGANLVAGYSAGDMLDLDWVEQVCGAIWEKAVRLKEEGQVEYLTRPEKGVTLRHCLNGSVIRLRCPSRHPPNGMSA